jgi:hypothetical protein
MKLVPIKQFEIEDLEFLKFKKALKDKNDTVSDD